MLKPDADLPRTKSPFIQGQPFVVTVQVAKPAENGVLVAQGGSQEGYSLYVKNGTLAFAMRQKGKLTVVEADRSLPEGNSTVVASIDARGNLGFAMNGEPAGGGKLPGPLVRMPVDGLQVGRDRAGAVGPTRRRSSSEERSTRPPSSSSLELVLASWGHSPGGPARISHQASSGLMSSPWTSVSRKSRPWWRKVKRVWSRPSWCRIVA